ncbi:GSCOCG00007412001-RA-CDS [Cotesia congregata]|nr:GSCOCG00007412001-RA-CDS [Cotesia congregata]
MFIFCGNFIKIFLFLLCVIGSICKSEDIVTEEAISSSTVVNFNSTVSVADNFANYDTSLESVSNKSSEDQKINLNTTVKPPEEPKLPEDLISQDVLLDPNIVLARLSRDLRGNYQPYYGHSSNYWPSRRISSKNIHKKYRGDNIKRRYEAPRIKIYPVFPGK